MPTEKHVVTVIVDERLMSEIEEYRFGNRIGSRSEALRRLIEKGLRFDQQEKSKD